jgi:hypothetical protein
MWLVFGTYLAQFEFLAAVTMNIAFFRNLYLWILWKVRNVYQEHSVSLSYGKSSAFIRNILCPYPMETPKRLSGTFCTHILLKLLNVYQEHSVTISYGKSSTFIGNILYRYLMESPQRLSWTFCTHILWKVLNVYQEHSVSISAITVGNSVPDCMTSHPCRQ